MSTDHYRTLDVNPGATQAELRTAYLKLARANHPDQFDGTDRKGAESRMQAINEAWNVLGVSHKRKAYDATRDSGTTGASTGPMRGNAHFRPFHDDDDFDPIDRSDVDLDPTPIHGSKPIPRWISMLPLALLAGGISFLGVGLLLRAGAIIGFAAVIVLLGLASFLMMPLIVMSRAERDPNL